MGQKIDPRKKELINAALERSGGNRRIAAELLDWNYENLQMAIRDCEDLRLRWGKGLAEEPALVSDADGLNEVRTAKSEGRTRKAALEANPTNPIGPIVTVPGSEISVEDEALAMALEKENRSLRLGLTRMGLTPAELEMGLALQGFHRAHFRESIEINGAGLTRAGLRLQIELDEIKNRLSWVRAQLELIGEVADETRRAFLDEEKDLMAGFVAVSEQLRRNMEVSDRGAMTMALIRARFGKGPMKSANAKPGFSPVTELEA